ncbi:signal peptidase II [Defluviimonas sp. SAOS-178_SWC]|uniref:signal peptidase II n=1 Tax=Defluviimonas sp. SAOS-178_SWC TaxID=3121287 RepID=UPI00322150E0
MRLVTQTAAGIFALDQVSKFFVVQALDLYTRQRIDVLPPWLNLRMAWNQGINFGLFSSNADLARWVLIAMAVVISLWVWLWVRREPHSRIVKLSAGFLIGGAMGNVLDRILYGAVADFLNMSVPGIDNPYSFNVADIAIFAGAIGLVLFTGREKTP